MDALQNQKSIEASTDGNIEITCEEADIHSGSEIVFSVKMYILCRWLTLGAIICDLVGFSLTIEFHCQVTLHCSDLLSSLTWMCRTVGVANISIGSCIIPVC